MPRNRPLIENPDDITLTEQDDIQQILGHPPGWILRWGVTVLMIVVALLLTLSWLIQYPDIITAKVELTTENPVIPMVAKKSGQLSILLVADGEKADSGAVLAVVENSANFSDMLRLEALLSQTDTLDEVEMLSLPWPDVLVLGELQPTYASFKQKINDYVFFGGQRAVFDKITSLRSQINYLDSLNISLSKQSTTLLNEKDFSRSKVRRDSTLLDEGAVSAEQYEESQAIALGFDRRLEIIQTQIFDNNVRIKSLEVQIIDLEQGRREDKNFKELSIQEDIDRLKGQLNIWKQQNLLIASISGKVILDRVWSPKQFVKQDQIVMTLVPEEGMGKQYGRAEMPIAGSGKVQLGSAVNISLAAFPAQEFGVVKGEVSKIAPIPSDYSNYVVEIKLPDTLITTYKDTLPFNQQLIGTAEIITEDRRLIERFFDKILDMVRN